MQGGIREGAGRKPKADKKIMKNIYLTQGQINQIEAIKLDNCKNFSQRCSELIDRGILSAKESRNSQMNKNNSKKLRRKNE